VSPGEVLRSRNTGQSNLPEILFFVVSSQPAQTVLGFSHIDKRELLPLGGADEKIDCYLAKLGPLGGHFQL
jgi:hypothetical protein